MFGDFHKSRDIDRGGRLVRVISRKSGSRHALGRQAVTAFLALAAGAGSGEGPTEQVVEAMEAIFERLSAGVSQDRQDSGLAVLPVRSLQRGRGQRW